MGSKGLFGSHFILRFLQPLYFLSPGICNSIVREPGFSFFCPPLQRRQWCYALREPGCQIARGQLSNSGDWERPALYLLETDMSNRFLRALMEGTCGRACSRRQVLGGVGVGGRGVGDGGGRFNFCLAIQWASLKIPPNSTAVHSVSVGVGLWDRKQQSAVTCQALVTVEGRKCLPQHYRVHFQEVKKKKKNICLYHCISPLLSGRTLLTQPASFQSWQKESCP